VVWSPAFTHGEMDNYSISYDPVLNPINITGLSFFTDTVGTYHLQFSVDGGYSWQAAYASPSAKFGYGEIPEGDTTTIYASSTTSEFILWSVIYPVANFPTPLTQDQFKIRITCDCGSDFNLSGVSAALYNFDYQTSRIYSSDVSFNPLNEQAPCGSLDVGCILKSLFVPNAASISGQLTSIQSLINNKAPFAYVSSIFHIDLSLTNASASIPAINIPVYAEYKGHMIINTHLALSDGNNNLSSILSYIRPIFVIMLWIGFIFFLIMIGRNIMTT
jgi:hypothetical protein